MSKKSKGVEAAPSAIDYKPRVYLDVREADVDQLSDLNVGKMVTVLLKGKLVGISKHEDKREGGKTEKRGNIELENPKVRIEAANVFSELAED